jgi:hypothetical protein
MEGKFSKKMETVKNNQVEMETLINQIKPQWIAPSADKLKQERE